MTLVSMCSYLHLLWCQTSTLSISIHIKGMSSRHRMQTIWRVSHFYSVWTRVYTPHKIVWIQKAAINLKDMHAYYFYDDDIVKEVLWDIFISKKNNNPEQNIIKKAKIRSFKGNQEYYIIKNRTWSVELMSVYGCCKGFYFRDYSQIHFLMHDESIIIILNQ